MEGFYSSLKVEWAARNVTHIRDAARADECNHVKRFYNARRRHSKMGYLSPMAFEKRAMQT
ncbi:hypothetical protein P775_00835 [Puniceibacterium antarcticum]|uniref:Integrase catalytic domain-containing protein n=1 Tax=Puniceibacterium antarcticum TaxID=1206336 RepID=A0A2G8RKU9_9RHOB|nr:hypothetical protein P775_00835 [Puniceibacterium antarcticum]